MALDKSDLTAIRQIVREETGPKFDGLDKRTELIEKRLILVEKRLGKVEKKVDKTFNFLDKDVSYFRNKVAFQLRVPVSDFIRTTD